MPPRSPRITWQRAAAIGLVWVVATALVLLWAADTKVGPILVRLSPHHGVHLGDVVALVVTYAAAAALSWWIWRAGRRRPTGGIASGPGGESVGATARDR